MSEKRAYEELDMVAIPEDIPELGVKADDEGTIATVYDSDGALMLDVEMSRPDGTSAGFVDLEVAEDGTPRVVGYSPLSY